MRPKAYSYIRFSSEPQKKGDSLRRQTEAAVRYAAQHDLDLDTQTYRDLGMSAFKSKNFSDGKLGLFIKAVEDGIVKSGSYLLVEDLDRFSRDYPDIVLERFLYIMSKGITIVTLTDEQVYSTASVRENTSKLTQSIYRMDAAHFFSKRRSGLISSSWAGKREKLAKGQIDILTRMAPAWLSVNDKGKWVIDPIKAKLIKRIYQMAIEGMGTPNIAHVLREEGAPTFGTSKEWSHGTVAHILKNKAVFGTLETKKQPAIAGYFKPVITEETFYKAQQAKRDRQFAPGTREGTGVGNLFQGRSVCGLCGERMKSVSAANGWVYIHCNNAYEKRGCEARRVSYPTFEKDILRYIVKEMKQDLFSSNVVETIDPRPAMQAQLDEKDRQIKATEDIMIDVGKSDSLIKRLRQYYEEHREIAESLKKALPPLSMNEVFDTSNDMLEMHRLYEEIADTHPDERPSLDLYLIHNGENFTFDPPNMYKFIRERFKVALQRIVKQVRFHHKPAKTLKDGKVAESYQVIFMFGKTKDFTYHRPAKGFQKGNVRGSRT